MMAILTVWMLLLLLCCSDIIAQTTPSSTDDQSALRRTGCCRCSPSYQRRGLGTQLSEGAKNYPYLGFCLTGATMAVTNVQLVGASIHAKEAEVLQRKKAAGLPAVDLTQALKAAKEKQERMEKHKQAPAKTDGAKKSPAAQKRGLGAQVSYGIKHYPFLSFSVYGAATVVANTEIVRASIRTREADVLRRKKAAGVPAVDLEKELATAKAKLNKKKPAAAKPGERKPADDKKKGK